MDRPLSSALRLGPGFRLLLSIVAFPAGPSAAQQIPPVVNPATYESRSGEYVLEVDPSQRYGAGPASYRMSRQGRLVWSGERPFTLLDAKVGDDGIVAGHAYSAGRMGSFANEDALHLLILDAAGGVRLDDTLPRRQSRIIHGGPEPNVRGVVFDPDADRVVFRVADVTKPEVWKPFQLSNGRPAPPFQPVASMPGDEERLSIVDAQPVRGTPLTLVHWFPSDSEKPERGARFTLLDPGGRSVWTLDLPKDHTAPAGDTKAQARADTLANQTAILDVSHSAEFEVRVARIAERVRHVIEKDAKARWTVREAGRQPFAGEPPIEAAVPDAGPERPLRYVGAIRLGGPQPGDAAIRDVHEFDIDDRGRFGMARAEAPCIVTFVIGRSDERPRAIALGARGDERCTWPLVAWAGGNTWLVTFESASADKGPAGWWVDSEAGTTRPFLLPTGVSVRAVAGRPGGGVVLLGEVGQSETVLSWLDVQGREERAFRENPYGTASLLLSPHDVVVTTQGDVVVVDAVRHVVVVFDASASARRSIDLAKAWGREPGYSSGIARDADGGFMVEDFGGSAPFVRMRPDGTVRGELRPRYPDGRATGRLFRVRTGPDGGAWGSDGEALLRLTDDGIVEGAVGAAASVDALSEIAAAALDSSDRIHAADRRTGAVHVFDAKGMLDHVCRPDPGDVKDALDSPGLTVTGDGRVFLRADAWFDDKAGVLEFASSGQRVGRHASRERSRLWNPASGGFWAVETDGLALVDETGQVQRKVERRADRNWLEWVSAADVAEDGSIAITARSGSTRGDPQEWSLNLYASDGMPVRTIRLALEPSSDALAYDGRSIALWQSGELRVSDTAGIPIARFTPSPEGRPARDWPLFFAAHGRELWMLDAAGKTMHRFAMPAP